MEVVAQRRGGAASSRPRSDARGGPGLRRRLNPGWVYRHEPAVAGVIFAIPPTDTVARKTGEPNKEGQSIPQRNQRQLFPKRILLQAPDTNHPGHSKSQAHVSA